MPAIIIATAAVFGVLAAAVAVLGLACLAGAGMQVHDDIHGDEL